MRYEPAAGFSTVASTDYTSYMTTKQDNNPSGITIKGSFRLDAESESGAIGAIYLTDGFDSHNDEVYILFTLNSGKYKLTLGYNVSGSGSSDDSITTVDKGKIVKFEVYFTAGSATSYVKLFEQDGIEIFSKTNIDLTHTPANTFDELSLMAWHTASDYIYFNLMELDVV